MNKSFIMSHIYRQRYVHFAKYIFGVWSYEIQCIDFLYLYHIFKASCTYI